MAGELPDWSLPERLKLLGEYERSAVEYLRVGFKDPEYRSISLERASLCYQISGSFEKAFLLAEEALRVSKSGLERAMALFRLCSSALFMDEEYMMKCSECMESLGEISEDGEVKKLILKTEYLRIMRAIVQSDFDLAQRLLEEWREKGDKTLSRWIEVDSSLLRHYSELKLKSPWVSGILSFMLPGAGRVYNGRFWDGIISFVMVAFPAVISAINFHESGMNSGYGWTFASIALIFHIGDIYGAIRGAKLINRRGIEEVVYKARSIYMGRLD
jgi:hypothetical protein